MRARAALANESLSRWKARCVASALLDAEDSKYTGTTPPGTAPFTLEGRHKVRCILEKRTHYVGSSGAAVGLVGQHPSKQPPGKRMDRPRRVKSEAYQTPAGLAPVVRVSFTGTRPSTLVLAWVPWAGSRHWTPSFSARVFSALGVVTPSSSSDV